MPNAADRSVASPGRTWLLAACAFGLAVILWDVFASPRFTGALGADYWDDGGPTVWTVKYVAPEGGAANAGLRVGDKVAFKNTVAYRRGIVGQPFPVRVQRGSNVFDVSIEPVSFPFNLSYSLANVANGWGILFAIVVVWFGVGRRARLVSWLFLFWALDGFGLSGFVTPYPWVNEVAYLLGTLVNALPVILLASISSTFGRPIGALRRALEWTTYAVATVGIAAIGFVNELTLITPWFNQFWSLLVAFNKFHVGDVANLLAAACAFTALTTVQGEERRRAAWLLTPLGLLCVLTASWSIASEFAGGYYGGAQQALNIVFDVTMYVLFGLMTYAVLRRTLVDIEFVANRAVVFAGVSFVVIGIFVAFEWVFNTLFDRATHTESTVASLGIALALGVSLSYIHHYVDRFVDHVFFRKRHEREKALRDFAHEAAFITDRDALLDFTVREVRENAETDDIAILLSQGNTTYATARTTNGVTTSVQANDRAIVKVRAWHKPIDLHEVETTLKGTRVYPLMSRGELLGILVCGDKRDHQGFAPDEDDALFTMARGVGSALGALSEPSRNGMTDVICELRDMMREQRAMMLDLRADLSESSKTKS